MGLGAFWADLKSDSAREERRGSWAISLLYRRPGIVLAFGAARLGLAPLQITFIGLLLALSMPLQAAFLPIGAAVWAVAMSGALFQVLDCADGALARCTGQTSRRGGDWDVLVDMAQWGLLYLALGLLADRLAETGQLWTAIALAAAWARLLARLIRDRVAWMAESGSAPESQSAPPSLADLVSRVLGGISGLFPFFALLGEALPWAVGFLLVYALLDMAEGSAPLFR